MNKQVIRSIVVIVVIVVLALVVLAVIYAPSITQMMVSPVHKIPRH